MDLKHWTKVSLIAIGTTLMSISLFANTPDLVGKWRSIDDKTGWSKAVVEFKKDGQGIYTGTVIEITPRPGYTPQKLCINCPGDRKNKPILGISTVRDMQRSENNPLEYSGGTILDPLNGKVYKSRIKLNPTGTRLTMRGYVGVEILGRSQTWIRQE